MKTVSPVSISTLTAAFLASKSGNNGLPTLVLTRDGMTYECHAWCTNLIGPSDTNLYIYLPGNTPSLILGTDVIQYDDGI